MAEATLTTAPAEEAPEVESLETTSPAAAESVETTEKAPETPVQSEYEQAMAILARGRQKVEAPDVEVPDFDPLDGGMDGADPIDLRHAAESAEKLGEAPKAEAANTETEETPAAEETDTPAAELEKPAVEPTPTDDTPEGRKRLNINRKGRDGQFALPARERAILSKMADELCTYQEAERELFGGPESPARPEAKPATDTKPEAKGPTVEEITAKIEELSAKRRAVKAEYGDDSEITDQIEDLKEQRAELKIEAKLEARRTQERQEAARAQAQQTFAQQEQDAWKETAGMYPEAAKEGTKLHAAVQAEIDRLEQARDPVLQSPRWLKIITRDVADRLGIAPHFPAAKPADAAAAAKTQTAKPSAPAAKPSAPVKRATPLISPGGMNGTAGGQTGPHPLVVISQKLTAAVARQDTEAIAKLKAEKEALLKRSPAIAA